MKIMARRASAQPRLARSCGDIRADAGQEANAPAIVRQLDYNLLFRWFVGLGVDDPVWDHSTYSKNRDRLLEADIARTFLKAIQDKSKSGTKRYYAGKNCA